jgi:hypothetical protein
VVNGASLPVAHGGRVQWHRWPEVSGVNDTADYWWPVSMALPIKIDTADLFVRVSCALQREYQFKKNHNSQSVLHYIYNIRVKINVN